MERGFRCVKEGVRFADFISVKPNYFMGYLTTGAGLEGVSSEPPDFPQDPQLV